MSEKEIHLFVPSFRIDEVLAEMRECLEKGWTGLGFKTVAFEEAWKKYSGFEHAHFLNSATAALHLAFLLLKEKHGWSGGDEIITTPFTFVSTNHAILYCDLKPVFADVDEMLCLDPASVLARITPRTRAVCFVGLGGNIGQYAAIRKLCDEKGVALILDASHMAGTKIGHRHAGLDADVTIFSYQAVKNLPTADSGMICFRDASLDREARKWSWLGISQDTYTRTLSGGTYKWLYDVEHAGFKYNGNSLMAAMALVGLKYLDEDNAYRRQIATWYDEELGEVAAVERVSLAENFTPSRHLYQVMVEKRDATILALHQRKIYPGVHYNDNIRYRMYVGAEGSCPRARYASEHVISLPMHLRLSEADVRRVARALREIVG